MILLTRESIEKLRTPAGGFNQATADALAICWPLQPGWIERLIGTEISNKRWRDAQRAAAQGAIYRRRGNTRKA